MSSLNRRRAVYTGVFDPVHLGHLDIIERGSRLYEHLIIGVGVNPDKKTFFDSEERVRLLREVVERYGNVEVVPFSGLAVAFVRAIGAGVMLRGMRGLSDIDYEVTMSMMNRKIDEDIETVFLMSREEFSHLSSSLMRQVAMVGGPLHHFLPTPVAEALSDRAAQLLRG